MAPAEAKTKVGALFTGAMQGRTMYVVPYIMGPITSPYSQIGVELTDSPYVAVSMRIMTRMGQAALDRLGHRITMSKACTRSGISVRSAALSCISPKSVSSGLLVRGMVAMLFSAKVFCATPG